MERVCGAARRGERPRRWPVFLRGANDHDGARTPLLHDAEAWEAALDRLGGPDGLLAVEFLETRGADGLYRKYSAFRIGDAIVPRHVFFGREWELKHAGHVDGATVEEELAYVRTNPHERALREVFDLARVEYGRIDYAMRGDRPQVWEINTNPMIMGPHSFRHPERKPVHAAVLPKLKEAFEAIDTGRRWPWW